MKKLPLSILTILLFVNASSFGQVTTQAVVEKDQIAAQSFFDANRLVDIVIELDKKDWDTLRSQSRSIVKSLGKQFAPSPFTYVKANVTIDGKLIKDVGIRKKGFLGSLDEHRPSLKIKFAEYRDQDPVDGLDRLTLNNNKQDPAGICQYLSYKLFNESGTVSPRCGLAKVTVNGNYLGIYSNVESIKPQFLERGFGDGTGDLFEGTVTDFFPAWVKKFETKNKGASLDQIQRVAELMASEKIDLVELEKVVDIDAFLKFWAMESLIGFWDGYCNNQNNFFIYQKPANSKLYFIPWGLDSSFTSQSLLPPYRIRPKSVHAKAILPNKLYRIPEIQDRYLARLKSFLKVHWNEDELLAEIDRLEAMLEDHVRESNDEFGNRMKKYRKFVTTRRASLERELKKGAPELVSREHLPTYFETIGKATVSFSTKWYRTTPRQTNSDVELDLEFNGKKIELEGVHAYGEYSKLPSAEKTKPPTVVIVATRKSDGKRLTLGMGFSPEQFLSTTGKATNVNGIFIEGINFWPKGGMQIIGGTAIMEQASMTPGEPVIGSMELIITKMREGKPVDAEDE